MKKITLFLIAGLFSVFNAHAADNDQLIRSDLHYVGGFVVSYHSNGVSKTGFSNNRIVVREDESSFFMTGSGADTDFAIAEFDIPVLVNGASIADLNETGAPLQEYADFKSGLTDLSSSDDTRVIGGMQFIGSELYVTVHDTYRTGTAIENLFVIENPDDLSTSAVRGYMTVDNSDKAAGWLSPIPPEHQAGLGGDYFMGNARQASVNIRWSIGPSGYSFNLADLTSLQTGETLSTNQLQMYDIGNRLWWQLPRANNFNYFRDTDGNTENYGLTREFCPQLGYNLEDPEGLTWGNRFWKQACVYDNDLWTEVSRGFYGVIVPNTETYMAFGKIGGTRKGMGYKIYGIDSKAGTVPSSIGSGEAPFDEQDWDSMVWMFDVQDMKDHYAGLTESYDAFPYDYGKFSVRHEDEGDEPYIIGGADYVEATNRVYVSLNTGGESETVILVYEIQFDRPEPPTNVTGGTNLTWTAPTLRIDGTPITGTLTYEVKSQCGINEFKGFSISTVTAATNLTLDPLHATCKISVAAIEDDKYSAWVWNGTEPLGRDFSPTNGEVIE